MLNVLGIDLGTTFSCVSTYRNGRLEVIYDSTEPDKPLTPSVVGFSAGTTKVSVGFDAQEHALEEPSNTIYGTIHNCAFVHYLGNW